MLALVGCSGGSADGPPTTATDPPESTVVTTAPSTTASSTTTAPISTTTAASTTTTTTSTTMSVPTTTVAPPTSTPPDPAVVEITERLNAIWPAWDACRADPAGCDIDALIAQFAVPDSPTANLWRSGNAYLVAEQLRITELDKVERFVAAIDVDGDGAVSQVCERDAAVAVSADGSMFDDTVGLMRYEWIWTKVDGQWRIIGGQHLQITDKGSQICDAYLD